MGKPPNKHFLSAIFAFYQGLKVEKYAEVLLFFCLHFKKIMMRKYTY